MFVAVAEDSENIYVESFLWPLWSNVIGFQSSERLKWIFDVWPKVKHHGGALKKKHPASATSELLRFAGCSHRGDCGGRRKKKKMPARIPSSLNSHNAEGELTRAASRAGA